MIKKSYGNSQGNPKADLRALQDVDDEDDGNAGKTPPTKTKKQKTMDPLVDDDESSRDSLFHLAPSVQGRTVREVAAATPGLLYQDALREILATVKARAAGAKIDPYKKLSSGPNARVR